MRRRRIRVRIYDPGVLRRNSVSDEIDRYDVKAVQSGREPLDYSSWDSNKDEYIQAIHQGMSTDYRQMETCVRRAENKKNKRHAEGMVKALVPV